jgi:peptidoglycan-associated lipoprotein
MQMNRNTLAAAALSAMWLFAAAGCSKKAPVATALPPAPAAPNTTTTPSEPPPAKGLAPRIDSFTANPVSILPGESSTLTWSVANATDIIIDQNVGTVAANATRQVFPGVTTTFNLNARGPGGMASRSVTVTVTGPPPPPPSAPKVSSGSSAQRLNNEARDAYFDYDKSDIRDDARQALNADAALIRSIFASDPNFTIVIEGHCDERGSAEYNLGLGDRRASAAKDFLVQLGIPTDRIRTISYGKERPVCTDADEGCYQRNRRAHLAPAQ